LPRPTQGGAPIEHGIIWAMALVGVSPARIVIPVLLALIVLAAVWIGVRWVGSEQVDLVRAVPLFGGLAERQLRSVLASARQMEFGPGMTIVQEGSSGRSFPSSGFARLLDSDPSAARAIDERLRELIAATGQPLPPSGG